MLLYLYTFDEIVGKSYHILCVIVTLSKEFFEKGDDIMLNVRDISLVSKARLAEDFYNKFTAFAVDLYPDIHYTREYAQELAETAIEIRRRAVEKEELLLGHYYQRPEVQEVCDFVGDSLGLGLEAKKILEMSEDELSRTVGRKISRVRMSAVRFMGDTVKIILGNKMRVFMPRFSGCSLVASLHGIKFDYKSMKEDDISKLLLELHPRKDAVDLWREKNPEGIVLSYMNSTPEAKAKSWAVYTSRNGLKILEAAMRENPGKRILMLPDRHLVAVFLGLALKQDNPWIKANLVDPFQGACHVHEQKINLRALDEVMDRYPNAIFLIHPECGCAVDCMARASSGELKRESYFFSTQEMIWHASKPGSGEEFIVATETGMIYTLRKNAIGKRFYPVAANANCEFMKATTLENLLESLRDLDEEKYEVFVPEDVREKAWQAIDRMLKMV